jgi:hypothetical protein
MNQFGIVDEAVHQGVQRDLDEQLEVKLAQQQERIPRSLRPAFSPRSMAMRGLRFPDACSALTSLSVCSSWGVGLSGYATGAEYPNSSVTPNALLLSTRDTGPMSGAIRDRDQSDLFLIAAVPARRMNRRGA